MWHTVSCVWTFPGNFPPWKTPCRALSCCCNLFSEHSAAGCAPSLLNIIIIAFTLCSVYVRLLHFFLRISLVWATGPGVIARPANVLPCIMRPPLAGCITHCFPSVRLSVRAFNSRRDHWKFKFCVQFLQHIHCVSKKTFDHNFGKCTPIFKILSLTDSQGNFLCNFVLHGFPPTLNCVATVPCEIQTFIITDELLLVPSTLVNFTWTLTKLNNFKMTNATKNIVFTSFMCNIWIIECR